MEPNEVEMHGMPLDGTDRNQVQNANAMETPLTSLFARTIKLFVMAFFFAGFLICLVTSKVTFASITGDVFYVVNKDDGVADDLRSRIVSVGFVQLTLVLAIPDAISLFYCFFWGVLGKTTRSYPWPKNWKIMASGALVSLIEVVALCGFVFGVACLLSPSLTILVLNGVFGTALAFDYFMKKYLERRLRYRGNKGGYSSIDQDNNDIRPTNRAEELSGNQQKLFRYLDRKIAPILYIIACLLQVVVIVVLPILLYYDSVNDGFYKKHIFVLIILPTSLIVLSVLWSPRMQNFAMQSNALKVKHSDNPPTARMKAGFIYSMIRLFCLPFISYGFAHLISNNDSGITIDIAHGFEDWSNDEIINFLAQIFTAFAAYLFAQFACAFSSWLFFIPLFLSTPISFGWFALGKTQSIFPFEHTEQYAWHSSYYIYLVAAIFSITEILIFMHFVLLEYANVLLKEEQLFWAPRYSGSFVEQYLLLNRKTTTSDDNGVENKLTDASKAKQKRYVFICSTMYHENETEMKQLLKSIYRVAEASGKSSTTTYESHIFFDNACSGDQFNKYVMTLLGLLSETLKFKPHEVAKIKTPYGYQLQYRIQNTGAGMAFCIHLKDNSKVKNKKRWSQVMYMKYVLFRIKNSKHDVEGIDENNTFIVTTDADVDFTSNSVEALLDVLAQGGDIGAVCARTYPLGEGPVVWYQKFDYAIGHWFQKAAEDILGCVLCCPGCFSAFRVIALEQVLSTYSTNVENGFDFLTKDMGEDRWLCTLLIENGWRLVYAAVSEDSTFCPDNFEEFFKQRRRWIPSTIANLAQVINDHGKITSNNDSITFLFILYQFIIVFASLISPATIILIVVTGLTASNGSLNELAIIIVLIIVSFLYGIACVYSTEKTQLQIAKALTFVFSIVMAVVIAGILTDAINSAIEGDPYSHLNITSNSTIFRFPVDVSVVYLGTFAGVFIVAGILHINELFNLFHFIWYLLCLPAGYLLLTIYSFANINNRSWGTREEASKKKPKSNSWQDQIVVIYRKFENFFRNCLCHKQPVEDEPPPKKPEVEYHESGLLRLPELSESMRKWLHGIDCERYEENFQEGGYTEECFVATMKMEDIKAIGINKRGFQLKIEKEVKKLKTPELVNRVPKDIEEWLSILQLRQYVELFRSEGYYRDEDVENLKGLTRDDLQKMGITRRAHLNQLMMGLHTLQYPTDVEIQTNKTRVEMENVQTVHLNDVVYEEYVFWNLLANDKLKPESANLANKELKDKLKNLRNICLLILLLTNIMWIVFLYTLVFHQLVEYNLPDRAFSLLFLAIFGLILVIQFFAMLLHRLVTLFHWLARIKLLEQNKGGGGFDEPVLP